MGYLKTAQPDQLLIEDGTRLEAKLTGCAEVETPFDDQNNPGSKSHNVNFVFTITEQGAFEGQRVFGQAPLWYDRTEGGYKASRKYFTWAAALLDVEDIPEGVEVENEDLLDAPCIIEAGVKVRNAGTPEEVSRNFAKAVFPVSDLVSS